MGRFHANYDEPGTPPWVCCICGEPEYKSCKHSTEENYTLIKESSYRAVAKAMDFAANHPINPLFVGMQKGAHK
jgi:hypothetical protein